MKSVCFVNRRGFTFLEIMIGLGMLMFFVVFAAKMAAVGGSLAADNRHELKRVYWGRAAVEIVMEVASAKPDDFFDTDTDPDTVYIEDLTVDDFNMLRDLDQRVVASRDDVIIEVTIQDCSE